MAIVRDFSALTTGLWRWNEAERVGTPTVVTYSFLEHGELPSFGESPPVNSSVSNRYVPMTQVQRNSVRDALDQFAAQSGLRFVEVDDPGDATIKFHGNQSSDLTSWTYLPYSPEVDGDIHTGDVKVTITTDPNQSWTLDSSRGSSIYAVILHEIGHAVGLKHPHQGALQLTDSMDNHDYTIMSYDWEWSGWSSGRARDTLGPLDLDAIHFLYGETAGFTAVWRPAGQFIEIRGGAGDDRIVTGRADSLMLGGEGKDRLTGAQFNDTLKGGNGDDRLEGGAGKDRLQGQAGRDSLMGGGGNDLLEAVDGDDRLWGDNGDDRLNGGAGDDRLDGGQGQDVLLGAAGADFLHGRVGNDRMLGGEDNDTLTGDYGHDRLFGEGGDDVLKGQNDVDKLDGGSGNDYLSGGGGTDTLVGGAGADRLFGNSSIDRLIGGAGNDLLWGGTGADIFIFASGFGRDVIEDWGNGSDRISLSDYAGVERFADLDGTMRQRDEDVVIRLVADAVIVLRDSELSELDARDFIF